MTTSQLLSVKTILMTSIVSRLSQIIKRLSNASVILIAAIILTGICITTQLAQAAAPVSNAQKLVNDARKQIGVTVSYDPSYQSLEFPRGDVEQSTGVCTDVVIRAYRLQNIDLQQLVNYDMKKNWSAYPKLWGLKSTDRNIDHRRVPNLEVFFERNGQSLSTTDKSSFEPGDIVSWRLPGNNLPHIGIVSDKTASDGTPLIIHNIGQGTREEKGVFRFQIKGHYRY